MEFNPLRTHPFWVCGTSFSFCCFWSRLTFEDFQRILLSLHCSRLLATGLDSQVERQTKSIHGNVDSPCHHLYSDQMKINNETTQHFSKNIWNGHGFSKASSKVALRAVRGSLGSVGIEPRILRFKIWMKCLIIIEFRWNTESGRSNRGWHWYLLTRHVESMTKPTTKESDRDEAINLFTDPKTVSNRWNGYLGEFHLPASHAGSYHYLM